MWINHEATPRKTSKSGTTAASLQLELNIIMTIKRFNESLTVLYAYPPLHGLASLISQSSTKMVIKIHAK